MAQKPVVAAATIENTRDDVARELFGSPYADISGDVQNTFDGLGTDAFMRVTEIGKWYAYVDPSSADLPDEWNELFKVTWIALGIRSFRSGQDYHTYNAAVVLPLERQIADRFTDDWLGGTFLQTDDTLTPAGLRKRVILELIKQRTPLYPPILSLDYQIRQEFVELWNARHWEFKKRPVEMTIEADGDIAIGEGYTFDGFASQQMTIRLSSGGTRELKWIDATKFARGMAYYDGNTGRPKYFYDFDKNGQRAIQLLPAPDQAYTAFAIIYIGAPDFGTLTSEDGLKELPPEFRAHLVDTVVARMMSKYGREDNDAQRRMREVTERREMLSAKWDDRGASRHSAKGNHHMQFTKNLTSYTGTNVLQQR